MKETYGSEKEHTITISHNCPMNDLFKYSPLVTFNCSSSVSRLLKRYATRCGQENVGIKRKQKELKRRAKLKASDLPL